MNASRSSRKSVSFLVVGLGFLGKQRARSCKVARGASLAAVMDVDQSVSLREARRLGVRSELSLRDAIRRPDVDAVIVATPHSDHDRTIRMALDEGKHVLCEKPLTLRSDDARDLARLAEASGLRLATGLNHRFYAPVRDALQLVGTGRVGRVERVSARIGHLASGSFLESWHVDPAIAGGGTLMDNGPHACDLVRLILGDVHSADCQTSDILGLPFAIESDAQATFTAMGGRVGEVWSSWTQSEGYLSLEITGETGTLRVETAPWRLTGRLGDGTRIDRRYLVERIQDRIDRRRFGCERSLILELEAFLSRTGRNASAWDGVRVTAMIEAAYRSASHGRRVSTTSENELSSSETSCV